MAAFVLASVAVCWPAISTLAVFSFHHEFSSHVFVIPVLSLYLLYVERKVVFRELRSSIALGSALIVTGAALYWRAMVHSSLQSPAEYLPGATLAIVLIWMGGF